MLHSVFSDILFGNINNYTLLYYSSIYFILFLIIFLENGLPPMVWLPGDSLLFLTGMLAGTEALNLNSLLIAYCVGAFFGYELSFHLGAGLGLPFITRYCTKIVPDSSLKKSYDFYSRWGNVAITLGRFIPVFRTMIPFFAGMGRMKRNQFTAYNIIGALFWPFFICGLGYLSVTMPWLNAYHDFLFAGVLILFVLSILFSVSMILFSLIQPETTE
jgi:membrane-associated protein